MKIKISVSCEKQIELSRDYYPKGMSDEGIKQYEAENISFARMAELDFYITDITVDIDK